MAFFRGFRRTISRGFRFGRNFTRGFRRGFNTGFTRTTRPVRSLMRKVNYLTRMNNAEKKFFDDDGTLAPSASATSLSTWISAIAQGNTSQTRVGQSVKALSVHGRIWMDMFPASADEAVSIRLILYYTSSDPLAVPDAQTVLQGPEYLVSPLNMNSAIDAEYVVIMDRTITIDKDRPQRVVKFYRRLKHHLKWDQSGNTITDARRGQIFLLAVSNATIGQEPSLTYHTRIRFVDN